MMKLTFFLFLSYMCSYGQTNINSMEASVGKKEIKKDSLPNLERRIYAIQLNIPGSFEFYVNDIPARIENSGSMHNTSIDINAFMLKSGKYKFRLKVFPQGDEIKEGILPETASRIRVSLNAYERNTENFPFAKKGSFVSLVEFPVQKIDKRVPYLEITGEFEVELPYNLVGWSNSEDLSKMDREKLEIDVVNFYEKMRSQLNAGNGDNYINYWKKYDSELQNFEYTLKENIEKENNKLKENISKKVKGNMLPLENYKIVVFGNGKLTRLERLPSIEINNKKLNLKGESPLLRKGKISGVDIYPLILHKPKGSNSFEIIRK